MKKALFLPFLTMQTGHHQVADALMDVMEKMGDVEVKKVDLLHFANPFVEKLISKNYLRWISYAPRSFTSFYSKVYGTPSEDKQSFKVYELLLPHLEKLLEEEKPDIIICTQSAPSYLISILKKRGSCRIPVINVYTDFFVSQLWGREGIDYHFLAMPEMIWQLQRYGITEEKMIVTGIPIHPKMMGASSSKGYKRILISGGNCGLMDSKHLKGQLASASHFQYFVLCGTNKKLYRTIQSWRLQHVKAIGYISSREEMNALYDSVDAIITKPGGVTVSEALHKRLPIFIHSVLPGQEEKNFEYLLQNHLSFAIDSQNSIEQQLVSILYDKSKMLQNEQALSQYLEGLKVQSTADWDTVVNEIIKLKPNVDANVI